MFCKRPGLLPWRSRSLGHIWIELGADCMCSFLAVICVLIIPLSYMVRLWNNLKEMYLTARSCCTHNLASCLKGKGHVMLHQCLFLNFVMNKGILKGAWCAGTHNIASRSLQRHDVAATLLPRCNPSCDHTVCLLDWCAGTQTGSHKNCPPCIKWKKIYQVYPVPLRLFLQRALKIFSLGMYVLYELSPIVQALLSALFSWNGRIFPWKKIKQKKTLIHCSLNLT